MKILLVAYEFAPSASPQSLRWQYLCAELAALGHEVRVLAPDSPAYHALGLPQLPSAVEVRRTFAGPFHGLLRTKQKRTEKVVAPEAGHPTVGPHRGLATALPESRDVVGVPVSTSPSGEPKPVAEELNWKGVLWHAGLNWKGRAFHTLQTCAAYVIYPDLRGEWLPWAKKGLIQELESFKPDVVVTSHEPATTLQLGLQAAKLGYRWVADLGDPVHAPYTPQRWRRRAMRLERAVCRSADLITVTADSVCRLMTERHAREDRMLVIPQGFDGRFQYSGKAARCPGEPLEMLYTGSFYKFRSPDELIAAVVATPGVRLTVASINPPDSVRIAAKQHPEAIRLIGFQPHAQALRMQRDADVLVNISNELPDQVPGKIYEYLGAGKPILHLSSGSDDGALGILKRTSRAIAVGNDRQEIAASLRKMLACEDVASAFGLDLSPQRVEEFSWEASARRLAMRLQLI